MLWVLGCFFFQAEDGIRDLVRSRGLGDVYKRQAEIFARDGEAFFRDREYEVIGRLLRGAPCVLSTGCLLYTSDAADERSSVDLGGRRIIKKKKQTYARERRRCTNISRLTTQKEDTARTMREQKK